MCAEVRIGDVSRGICTTLCEELDECYFSNSTAAGRVDQCTGLASDGTVEPQSGVVTSVCIRQCDVNRPCDLGHVCVETSFPGLGLCLPE